MISAKIYILNIADVTLAQYALNLSDELYQHLRDTAKQHDTSVKELLFREKDDAGKVTEKQIILI